MIERRDLRAPLRLDDGRGIRFGDDRRAFDALSDAELLAPVERRVAGFSAGASPEAIASTETASATSALPGMRKENCFR